MTRLSSLSAIPGASVRVFVERRYDGVDGDALVDWFTERNDEPDDAPPVIDGCWCARCGEPVRLGDTACWHCGQAFGAEVEG